MIIRTEDRKLVCLPRRNTPKRNRMINLFYSPTGRILPRFTVVFEDKKEYKDCYDQNEISQAIVTVHIITDHKGRDNSMLFVKRSAEVDEKLYNEIVEDMRKHKAPETLYKQLEERTRKRGQ